MEGPGLVGVFRCYRYGLVTTGARLDQERKQVRVLQLINAYRYLGHSSARTDPLRRVDPDPVSELQLAYHELSDADLGAVFRTGSLLKNLDKSVDLILGILPAESFRIRLVAFEDQNREAMLLPDHFNRFILPDGLGPAAAI